jgi:hypothetical protein
LSKYSHFLKKKIAIIQKKIWRIFFQIGLKSGFSLVPFFNNYFTILTGFKNSSQIKSWIPLGMLANETTSENWKKCHWIERWAPCFLLMILHLLFQDFCFVGEGGGGGLTRQRVGVLLPSLWIWIYLESFWELQSTIDDETKMHFLVLWN